MLALRNVAEARLGGMAQLAEQAGLNRESLYRMLSEQGTPVLSSLDKLLHALGLRLSVEVDTSKVHATLKDGILTVMLPKAVNAKSVRVEPRMG